ncbi:hypothetical protein LTR08_005547 [Meristemomyces frigidus]|nr:hypothetical protein LTR08_005547 [Meristemomyces frigidus]
MDVGMFGTPVGGFGTPVVGSGTAVAGFGTSKKMKKKNRNSLAFGENEPVIDPRFPAHEPVIDPRYPALRGFDPTDKIVTVRVGDPETTFSVHRGLLSSSSEYFKTKAKPEWARGGASIDLPDFSPDAFGTYVKWLYLRAIPSTATTNDGSEQHENEFRSLTEAYVLGDRLLDDEFKDMAIDALRAKARTPSGNNIWPAATEMLKTVYAGTPEGSKARSLLVNIFQYHAAPDVFGQYDVSELPKEFLFELTRALMEKRGAVAIASLGGRAPPGCEYHSHGEGGKCYVAEWKSEGLLS